MTDLLSDDALEQELGNLDGWTLNGDRKAITKSFVFKNFVEAFSWMTGIALKAESMGHHPEWTNVYKTVTVTLTTHDADGLTAKDMKLARHMNEAARD